MVRSSESTPLILLVSDKEGAANSFEDVLRPKGQVVLRAYSGKGALDLVRKVSPDTIFVDLSLPDIEGQDLVRQLRRAPTVTAATPIVVLSGSVVGRAQRLEVLGSGAWDILIQPIDPNELILRIQTFVRAKQLADRALDETLIDPGTGLYNVRGILRRAKELASDASRSGRPMTCLAIGGVTSVSADSDEVRQRPTSELPPARDRVIADALLGVTRIADTLGRVGPEEFVIIAPGTDSTGAERLADRVLAAMSHLAGSGESSDAVQMKAGLYATDGGDAMGAEDLVFRATVALKKAQAEEGSLRIRGYDA